MKIVSIAAWRKKKRAPRFRLLKMLNEPDLTLRANELMVAVVIFQHVNLKTLQCWPSIETICKRAKVSRRTVIRAVKKMQEQGLVTVSSTRQKGKFTKNVYDFGCLEKKLNRVSR